MIAVVSVTSCTIHYCISYTVILKFPQIMMFRQKYFMLLTFGQTVEIQNFWWNPLTFNATHYTLNLPTYSMLEMLCSYAHDPSIFLWSLHWHTEIPSGSNIISELDTWKKSEIFREECSTRYAQIKQSKHNTVSH